jgi:hypothetical protein
MSNYLSKTVLIAKDNKDFCRMMHMFLEIEDYKDVEAENNFAGKVAENL